MDGFASNSASMEVNNVKSTLYNASPAFILLDTEILAQAPERMLWAGLGDMAAKYCSVCEWRIANIVIGEYYCEEVADMMRVSLQKIMAAAPRLMSRDPDAVQPIAEGLVTAGLAMAYAQVSRRPPGWNTTSLTSGKMQALERGVPYDLHGIQVGVGTMLTFQVLAWLKQVQPDRARAEKHMREFDEAVWAENIRRIFGKTADEILRAERKFRKNDPAAHQKRLDTILSRWDEIMRAIDEEMPSLDELRAVLEPTGMPLTPADIGIFRAGCGRRLCRLARYSRQVPVQLASVGISASWTSSRSGSRTRRRKRFRTQRATYTQKAPSPAKGMGRWFLEAYSASTAGSMACMASSR